jgi:type II secretory pathway component PulK
VLGEQLGEDRAQEITGQAGGGNFPSVLQFYAASGMTADEFALVHTDLTASNNPPEGLVNVNTASEAVLACLPGIGLDNAPALVAFRQANPGRLDSMAWVTEVLEPDAIAQCGRFLTDQAYQFTADVAAVGPNGRGFHRTRFVFDNSDGTPRIIFRRDLTALGWALSPWVREELQLARENQR